MQASPTPKQRVAGAGVGTVREGHCLSRVRCITRRARRHLEIGSVEGDDCNIRGCDDVIEVKLGPRKPCSHKGPAPIPAIFDRPRWPSAFLLFPPSTFILPSTSVLLWTASQLGASSDRTPPFILVSGRRLQPVIPSAVPTSRYIPFACIQGPLSTRPEMVLDECGRTQCSSARGTSLTTSWRGSTRGFAPLQWLMRLLHCQETWNSDDEHRK